MLEIVVETENCIIQSVSIAPKDHDAASGSILIPVRSGEAAYLLFKIRPSMAVCVGVSVHCCGEAEALSYDRQASTQITGAKGWFSASWTWSLPRRDPYCSSSVTSVGLCMLCIDRDVLGFDRVVMSRMEQRH